MSILFKIRGSRDSLTQSEIKISDYILSNKEEVINLSAQNLAKNSNTSPASVIRFSKKLGYSGFNEMKVDLIKDITTRKTLDADNIYEDIKINDSIDQVIEKLEYENIDVIKNTVKLLDKDEIQKAVNCIINSKKIYIFGVGASGLVAKDLQYKLMRIKKMAMFEFDSHTQLSLSANMEKDDVAIGISYSGRTLETFKALEQAKSKGACTISITNFGKNPLSDISDINIFIAGREQKVRVGAITSRIAQLIAIDVIFVAISKNNFELTSNYIKNTRNIVEELKINKK